MSSYDRDPRTVAYDWKEHLEHCEPCRTKPNEEHRQRVKELAEKYPLTCADCGGDLEATVQACYQLNAAGAKCGSTRLYFRAHQAPPSTRAFRTAPKRQELNMGED